MKKTVLLLSLCLGLSAACLHAEDAPMKYVDALEFRMINHWDEGGTFTPYTRIPASLKDSIRQELWDRGMNSAGIGIRFATNSKRIGVRYNLHSNFHMAHMADTGIKGTDLYIWIPDGQKSKVKGQRSDDDGQRSKVKGQRSDDDGQRSKVKGQRSKVKGQRSDDDGQRSKVEGQRSKVKGQRSKVKGQRSKVKGQESKEDASGHWAYVNTNRPTKDSIQSKTYVEHMDGTMHECLIYLPLYDGVNWMEIGVDSDAVLTQPQLDNPRKKMRVMNYGTSIMHGGCASRTGMAATNIMQRELNVEMVNLGVSGEGKLVYPMARAMAQMDDIIAYIIDPVPNCTQMMCDTLTYDFIKIIRNARPRVPIIMVEGPMYPYAKFDSYFRDYLPAKNEAFRKNFERLKAEGDDNLYYVTCEGLTGPDEEGTVDGIHLTDLGFRAYADKLEWVLREILNL